MHIYTQHTYICIDAYVYLCIYIHTCTHYIYSVLLARSTTNTCTLFANRISAIKPSQLGPQELILGRLCCMFHVHSKPVLARNGKRVIFNENMIATSCYLLWLVLPACFKCVSIASRAELASLARALRSLNEVVKYRCIYPSPIQNPPFLDPNTHDN